MKIDTIVNGLSDLINDYIENNLDSETAEMLEAYFDENAGLATFVIKSQQGRLALKKAYHVRAADDFEAKLAAKIGQVRAQENEAG